MKRSRKRRSWRPLGINPERTLPSEDSLKPPGAEVELIWRDEKGQVHHKKQPWKRPCTLAELREWLDEYFQKLSSGYQPAGYTSAPQPHCCRLYLTGHLVAEWMRKAA